jgi:DNA-binding CsgD family transcriptional regulator
LNLFNYKDEPPSKRVLKQHFIDANKEAFPQDTLNCVAHLILTVEDPDEMMTIALEFIVKKLEACRADIGFARPQDHIYKPASIYYSLSSDPPNYTGTVFSNQDKVFQKTWHQRLPVACDNVQSNPLLYDSRKKFESIQSKSILFQRLVWDKNPVGMACIDFTHEHHIWTPTEINFMAVFCEVFLGPLLGISHYWHDPEKYRLIKKPTQSELMAIKLAAKGMSYKQIADELGKSVRTIENQLRNARDTLNASNQAELITKCEMWL